MGDTVKIVKSDKVTRSVAAKEGDGLTAAKDPLLSVHETPLLHSDLTEYIPLNLGAYFHFMYRSQRRDRFYRPF